MSEPVHQEVQAAESMIPIAGQCFGSKGPGIERFPHERQTESCCLFRRYAAALSLNNIGVSLAEHGEFDQATEIFVDSLRLVRSFSATGAGISHFSDKLLCELDIKAQNYCFPTNSVRRVHEVSTVSIGQVGSFLCQEESAHFNTATTGSSPYLLIRMDELTATESIVSRDDTGFFQEGYETAIVLFNFASTNLLVASHVISHPARVRKSVIQALKLLRLSISIMDAIVRDVGPRSLLIPSDFAPISSLILERLVQVSTILNMAEEASMFYRRMETAVSSFRSRSRDNELENKLNPSVDLAPAA